MPAGFFEIDRMAFAGQLPWWSGSTQGPQGGGVYLPDLTPDAEGWAKMQEESGCGFTTETVQVLAADSGEVVPGQYTIRCSDGVLIPCTVGSKYAVMQADRMVAVMAQLGVKPHTMGTLLGRRKMWALGQLPGANEIKRREGDRSVILPYVLGSTSNDGSSNTRFGLTGVYVVCMNTLEMAHAGFERETHKLSARHTASADAKLDSVAEALGLAERAFRENGERMQDLANTPFSRDAMQTLACQLLSGKDDPQEARETIAKSEGRSRALFARKGGQLVDLFASGLGNRGNCALDAVNAVTEYVDHAKARTGAVDWDTQGASILWGAGAQLKARALALVTA